MLERLVSVSDKSILKAIGCCKITYKSLVNLHYYIMSMLTVYFMLNFLLEAKELWFLGRCYSV